MAEKKEYRSAVRSRRMIRQAFMELLQEKDFSKITVTDIVKRADLNRSTFYAHYPDVYGVVEELQNEILEKSLAMIEGENLKNILVDPMPFFQGISKLLEENMEFYRLVGNTLNVRLFLDKLRRRMAEDICRHPDLPEEIRQSPSLAIRIHFFTGGIMNTYQQWAEGNLECSLDEISQDIARFIQESAGDLFEA